MMAFLLKFLDCLDPYSKVTPDDVFALEGALRKVADASSGQLSTRLFDATAETIRNLNHPYTEGPSDDLEALLILLNEMTLDQADQVTHWKSREALRRLVAMLLGLLRHSTGDRAPDAQAQLSLFTGSALPRLVRGEPEPGTNAVS
jgi:hypothetical protein